MSFPRTVRFVLMWSMLALDLVGSAPATARPSNNTHTVLIKGSAFVPQRVEVVAGDTVIWTNEDIVPHTITARRRFDSHDLGPHDSWKYRPTRKGVYPFVCAYHPTMNGELVVK